MMPESSANAGKPEIDAAKRAFSNAFSTNVVPVSGGDSMANSDCGTTSTLRSAKICAISRTLPGLPLARTNFIIARLLCALLCVLYAGDSHRRILPGVCLPAIYDIIICCFIYFIS